MTEPSLLPDDDTPTGLPRIDGDTAPGDDAPAHDLEGLGIGDGEEDVGLDDGGFLDEDDEIDTLEESPVPDDDAWETAESEPHDDDSSIEAPEESSWVGASAIDGMGELGSGDEDDEREHAASAIDAGEEGFAEESLGDPEPDAAPSVLGAADEEGLDEVPELHGALEARGYELRRLAAAVAPVAHDELPGPIVALALAGGEVVALAASGDAQSVILWERDGRLSARARMPGSPRAMLLHPSLGLVVATSAGLGVLDGRFEPVVVRALATLGEGLLALADDGAVLEGRTPGSLAPRREPPARAHLCAPLAGGGVLLVDEDRTLHRLGADQRSAIVGRVPARDPVALAGAGAACVVLTRGGGAWMWNERERGFEPEPALRSATAIAQSGQAASGFVALVAGRLVRVTAGSPSEACALSGARVLAAGEDGVLVVATDVAVLRVRLGAPVLDEGHTDDDG